MLRTRGFSTLIAVLWAICLPVTAHAGLLVPDASFSFAPPMADRSDVMELLRSTMRELGFQELESRSQPTTDAFSMNFMSGAKVSVSFIGVPSCITASINLISLNAPEEVAKAQAKQAQSDLLLTLRSKFGDRLLLFRTDRIENQCSEPLQKH